MIPTLLITLREVIEASLIVATILGILVKLNQRANVKTVWISAISAMAASFFLVLGGSIIGVNVRQLYEGPLVEGSLYILSAFFITWAVFFLHNHFAQKKMHLLSHLRETIARDGIFAFTFVAVLREGIEISLFLSTQYLTSSSATIISGFSAGILLGVAVSYLFFRATVRLPIYWAFRTTSFLLIVFAGNMLAQGVGELLGIVPFMTAANSVNTLPALTATSYIFLMHRYVFVRSR